MIYSQCIKLRNRYYLISLPLFFIAILIVAAVFMVSTVELLITLQFTKIINTPFILGAINLINMSPLTVSLYYSLEKNEHIQFLTYLVIACAFFYASISSWYKGKYHGRLMNSVKRKRYEDAVMNDGNPYHKTKNNIVVKNVKGDVVIDQSQIKKINNSEKNSTMNKIMIGLIIGIILIFIERLI